LGRKDYEKQKLLEGISYSINFICIAHNQTCKAWSNQGVWDRKFLKNKCYEIDPGEFFDIILLILNKQTHVIG